MQIAEPHNRPNGYTLLELVAVLALISLIAAAAYSFKPDALQNFGAKADARRIALDLMQARRRAIATGDNHFLDFTPDAGAVTGYQMKRRGGSVESVDTAHTLPSGVIATVSADPEFTFEGSALATATIDLTGPHRSWRITVIQATGGVKVEEL